MDNLRSEQQTCGLLKIGKNDLSCSVLFNMPIPMILIDTETDLRYINAAARELLKGQHICGRDCKGDECKEEILSWIRTELSILTENNMSEYMYIKKIRTPGGLRPIRFNLRPIIGYEGCHSGFMAGLQDESIAIDIMDRKNAEMELKKSEEKYRKLVDSSPDAIVIHEDGKITFANQQAIKLFEGECEEDLIGKAVLDFVAPSLRDIVLERIKYQELHNEIQESIEEQILTLKGKIIDVEVKAALIEQAPKKIFQTVLRDISERKIMEDELRQKNNELEEIIKELERAQMKLIQQEKMAAIGQLAAGVAHEINNPLGFVLSNFEILKKYKIKYKDIINAYNQLKSICVTGIKEEIQSEVDNISALERKHNMHFIDYDLDELLAESTEGLERISKIVRGLSLFSRTDQNEEFAEYDLNMAIENTLLIVSNEIKYHANIDKKLGELPLLYGLGSQINQVILNLIVNAAYAVKVKESENMGFISIKTYSMNEHVYCEISDTGIGVPKEKLNRIFDPFFTTKPPGEGTGLGLSISYDIIKNKHKGDIRVESEEGVGTKFIIELPAGKQIIGDK